MVVEVLALLTKAADVKCLEALIVLWIYRCDLNRRDEPGVITFGVPTPWHA